MAMVLCVLYEDPADRYPPASARDGIPTIARYPDGQLTSGPDPKMRRKRALLDRD